MIIAQNKSHPVLYEINTRVWIHRFNKSGNKISINEVPDDYWQALAELGIDFVWLMGVWQTSAVSCKKHCFTKGLMRDYDQGLADWKIEDVIGSPYAIDIYTCHENIGTNSDLRALKQKLNSMNMKLILDFVPNHFSACTRLLKELPEIFIKGDEEDHIRASHIFFSPDFGQYFAHGRDPYFDPWQDTVQVNIFQEKARTYLTETLINIADICDGVRCDMAMLLLNDIFQKTWTQNLTKWNCIPPKNEFWKVAINHVREKYHNFLFIAEAYWDTGWRLQQLGFNYTYDKELYDRLGHGSAQYILGHLMAEETYQKKSVRFIENHDEPRAVTSLGEHKSKAAALLISTIQGLCFIQDGQCEGKKIRLPVQLGREKEEPANKEMTRFYKTVLRIRKSRIIQEGTWQLLWPSQAWDGNFTYNNFLAWMWKNNNTCLLVTINYSDIKSQCRVKFRLPITTPFIILNDLLGGVSYNVETSDLMNNGLFIEREAFHSHVFYFETGK